MHPIFKITVAVASLALMLPGSTLATDIDIDNSSAPEKCSASRPDLCLDGVGGGVTSLDSLRVSTGGRGSLVAESEERAQQQARANLPGNARGMAAGSSSMAGWTVWGGGSWFKYDSSVAIARYDADTYNFLFGADRMLGERTLLGFNLGYEDTDTDTFYNGGGQDRTGLLVGLYGAYLINDTFSVDAAVGYGALDTDENRVDTGSGRNGAPTPGASIFGSYDADRAYGTVNLNAVRSYGQWVVGARLGALYAVESQDAYTETGGTGGRSVGNRHLDLTQVYLSMDLGYQAGAFEPYALIGYRNDLGRDDGNSAGGLPGGVRPQPTDDDEWQGGIGVRYFAEGGITGSFEWLKTEGRKDFNEDSVSLSVRVPF